MISRFYFSAAIAAALLVGLGSTHAARGVAQPPLPMPRLDPFEELEKDLERFHRDLNRLLEQQDIRRRELQGGTGLVRWGGLRLKKVTAAQQENLGLPENEGLAVFAVDPNSAAEKAGVKASDILLKIGAKAVPSDVSAFVKLVKELDATAPVDLVVVRDGKEQTLKEARMPVVVQTAPEFGGPRGFGGFMPPRRINIDPRVPMMPFPNPFPERPAVQNLQLQMTMDGAKITRKQTNDDFSGEYAKDELKITIAGRIQAGRPVLTETIVQDGKDRRTYARFTDVPPQYRAIIQRHLMPTLGFAPPLFQGFEMVPGLLPVFPGIDN